MIKAVAKGADGKVHIFLGLSWANLDRLRADGLDGFIKVEGDAIGVPGIQIIITAGETEAHIVDLLLGSGLIGDNTKINISDKLKS